jgi:hypothetical protein
MTEGPAPVLIVMRLGDMHRVHPDQDNTHTCPSCGERVGIYPSGQRALQGVPGLTIICEPCWRKDAAAKATVTMLAPGAREEARESVPARPPRRKWRR